MTAPGAPTPTEFRDACRQWRQHRKLSQLDLALAADVSQRHVSWLETGRSQPSREMVIRLSEAMEIPLRERNRLLQAAGFAALYTEKRLDEQGMEPVQQALTHVLNHHDPFPAVAVDRFWNVVRQNRAAGLLLGLRGDPQALLQSLGAADDFNLALLTLHPEGLRPYISNWEQIAPAFVRRLRAEALASGDRAMQEKFEDFIALAGEFSEQGLTDSLLPVLPLELDIDGLELRIFSVITSFGTPLDVTADELRIEAFYPADAQTEAFFRG